MDKQHVYSIKTDWTGNKGTGTSKYISYERSFNLSAPGKHIIECSSDPSFLGDKTKYNPEELLVASVSSCHMLWFLHLCADAGIIVTRYSDNATGVMQETKDGGGFFTEITLNPVVTIVNKEMTVKARELHNKANKLCFIANSLNFPVNHNMIFEAE